MDCQNRVKLAYKIRGELIKALQVKKKKKTIQVYQIITKSDPNDSKNTDGSGLQEELVEIATIEEEVEDYNDAEAPEQIYVDESKQEYEENEEENADGEYFNEHETELITDELNAGEPLDAVSFLLEKKDLFKSDPNAGKKCRRSHMCNICEKSFMRKSNLVDHLRLHANVR